LLFFLRVLVPWWRKEKSVAAECTKFTITVLNFTLKGVGLC
jgi:hypothetical protein